MLPQSKYNSFDTSISNKQTPMQTSDGCFVEIEERRNINFIIEKIRN